MGFLLGLGLSDHPQTKFCFCLCAEVARQLKFKLPSGKVYLPPHSPARAESRQPCNLNTRAVIPFILACFHWRGLLKAIFCPHPHDVPAGKGEVRENQPEPAHSRVPVLSDRRAARISLREGKRETMSSMLNNATFPEFYFIPVSYCSGKSSTKTVQRAGIDS